MKLRKPKDYERFYVSKKDIEFGVPADHCNCPVALALKRRFKGDVAVGTHSVRIGKTKYGFSDLLLQFIFDFDTDEPVGPGHFTIRKVEN